MRASAVVRIIVWTFVALLLTGLLIGVMSYKKGNFPGLSIGSFSFYGYDDEDSYGVGSAEVDADFSNIDISWIDGKVVIEPYDGDRVRFTEDEGLRDDDRLRYRVSNGTLEIKCRKSEKFAYFGKDTDKTLIVRVPRDFARESATIAVQSTSASVSLKNMTCGAVKIESVSGGVSLDGKFGMIDIDGVSGDVDIECTSGSNGIAVNTVSGNILVDLPDSIDASLYLDTVSGKFSSEIPSRNAHVR